MLVNNSTNRAALPASGCFLEQLGSPCLPATLVWLTRQLLSACSLERPETAVTSRKKTTTRSALGRHLVAEPRAWAGLPKEGKQLPGVKVKVDKENRISWLPMWESSRPGERTAEKAVCVPREWRTQVETSPQERLALREGSGHQPLGSRTVPRDNREVWQNEPGDGDLQSVIDQEPRSLRRQVHGGISL